MRIDICAGVASTSSLAGDSSGMFDRFGLYIEVVGFAIGRAGMVASDDAIEVMRF